MSAKAAIIGSGNIGTDLMIKVMRAVRRPGDGRHGRHRPRLRRPGPRRAASASPPPPKASTASSECPNSTTSTSSSTPPPPAPTGTTPPRWHRYGKRLIDLTPAAIGPYVVPAVNLDAAPGRRQRQHGHLRRPGDHPDRRRHLPRRHRSPTPRSSRRSPPSPPVPAPAPTSTSSPRPPPTPSTAVGGAASGKAIIVLNPAEPPLIMRDTVLVPGRPARPRPTRTRSASRARRWSPTSPPTCRATGSSRTCSSTPMPPRPAGAHPCTGRGTGGRTPGVGVPRSRRRRPLPARLRRKPRHHDLRRAPRRRTAGRPPQPRRSIR